MGNQDIQERSFKIISKKFKIQKAKLYNDQNNPIFGPFLPRCGQNKYSPKTGLHHFLEIMNSSPYAKIKAVEIQTDEWTKVS